MLSHPLVKLIKSARQGELTTSAFGTDRLGNQIIPHSLFGGHSDIIVVDVNNKQGHEIKGVAIPTVIMAFEEDMDFQKSTRAWRTRMDIQKNVMNDINAGVFN
jgi:hypothetical protein